MISQEMIDQAVKALVQAAEPVKVILFGSYARGDADEGSDLDFLVIEREVTSTFDEMVRLRRALQHVPASIDIIVVSEQEAAEWGHLPSTTLYWALKEGKVLHEAAG